MTDNSSTDSPSPNHSHLIAKGWRQGVMLDAPTAAFAFNVSSQDDATILRLESSRTLKGKERLVLISHDCDIANAQERYVETLLCRWLNPAKPQTKKRIDQIERNSPREFVIDPLAVYVAQACYRIHIAKEFLELESVQPVPSVLDSLRFLQFREWLTRRYDRAAVPDELHLHFLAPVYKRLSEFEEHSPETVAVFNREVHEIRVVLPEDLGRPFPVGLIILVKGPGLTEQGDDAIGQVLQLIKDAVEPSEVTVLEPPEIYELEDAPYGLILKSEPLSLEYLSYDGDGSIAPPPWLAPWRCW